MSINWEFLVNTFFLSLSGIAVTAKITIISLLVALPLGFLMAVARIYRIPVLAKLSAVYISFVRGTPILVQILLIYSLLPSILSSFLGAMGSSFNIFDLNAIVYAYFIFSFNTVAILAEIFRSALLTVQHGQLEAAYAAGFTTLQAYRRIILPQALESAVPNLCTATTNLIKSTSLAFLMALKDITGIAKIQAGISYNYIEAYMDIWVIYILVCLVVEILFKLLEKRLTAYKAVQADNSRKRSSAVQVRAILTGSFLPK